MAESLESAQPDAGIASVSLEASIPAVDKRFVLLYKLAFLSMILLFLAPLLGTLALKINALVGLELAPSNLALVAGVGALLALFANPFFGMLSDRTSLRLVRRRTWMLIGLVLQSRLWDVTAGFVMAVLGAVLVFSSPEGAADHVAGV